MRGRKPKIDSAQALKLKLKGLSGRQIARQLGVHHSTVGRRLKKFEEILKNTDGINKFKQNEAIFQDHVRELAMVTMAEKLSDAEAAKKIDLRRIAMTYGILYDKQRLERGESTANLSQITRIIEAAHNMIQDQEGAKNQEVKGSEGAME